MKRIIWITLCCLALLGTARADEIHPLRCGDSAISVSPAKMMGGEQVIQDFLVTVTQPQKSQVFRFSAENDHLAARCEGNIKGEKLLLVQHNCGGSGCAESNYSIIDIGTFTVLLKADSRWKGNQTAAESVVGRPIKPFLCDKSQDEHCYHTKFE
jgi:hypothetical protein